MISILSLNTNYTSIIKYLNIINIKAITYFLISIYMIL